MLTVVSSLKAADGNRTRVTHLGKVVRNHYATAAFFWYASGGTRTLTPKY